jgi:hypothetical protein
MLPNCIAKFKLYSRVHGLFQLGSTYTSSERLPDRQLLIIFMEITSVRFWASRFSRAPIARRRYRKLRLLLISMANGTALCRSAACFSLLLVAPEAGAAQEATPVPPGQMVDLGGRRLHWNCSGTGSPTLLIKNGGDGFSVEWALVQPAIAKRTRVCTYDGAGYAWSDARRQ